MTWGTRGGTSSGVRHLIRSEFGMAFRGLCPSQSLLSEAAYQERVVRPDFQREGHNRGEEGKHWPELGLQPLRAEQNGHSWKDVVRGSEHFVPGVRQFGVPCKRIPRCGLKQGTTFAIAQENVTRDVHLSDLMLTLFVASSTWH